MDITLGNIEARFADMLWEREPLTTSEIVRLAAKEFDWKRTTTYTVLKRLSEKGLFKNDNGTVTSLIS
ncbi:MAG: BlaI/MecI/CopY family transcriptional regulator, partial [Ruminococcaceae bacterium]|nr:BlaI/MecI/CopY family transcriptional regulator [Oscillospiraceae bacterium]